MVKKHEPTAVITDLSMPGMTGLELLDELIAERPGLPVVLMTAYGGVNDAVSAMKAGAFDFIQKPFEGDALLSVMKRAVAAAEAPAMPAAAPAPRTVSEKRPEAPRSADSIKGDPLASIVGDSAAMQRVKQQLVPVAASDATVLIQGESGTGKEVVARACHAASPRRDKVMLCLNCAALSSSLLESELFGHEHGAFTGADAERKGRFEMADGGTLFLDEVSEIDPTLQAKLLRVLQEGQFERVGSSVTRTVDVRVIATSNRDLTRSVADGSFRQDLYYRLNVLPVVLPPLRERGGDVPALAAHFLRGIAQRSGSTPKRLTPDAAALLAVHGWPGNVRELQNLCERAAVLGGDHLDAKLFGPWLDTASARSPAPEAPPRPAPARRNRRALRPRKRSAAPPCRPPTSTTSARSSTRTSRSRSRPSACPWRSPASRSARPKTHVTMSPPSARSTRSNAKRSSLPSPTSTATAPAPLRRWASASAPWASSSRSGKRRTSFRPGCRSPGRSRNHRQTQLNREKELVNQRALHKPGARVPVGRRGSASLIHRGTEAQRHRGRQKQGGGACSVKNPRIVDPPVRFERWSADSLQPSPRANAAEMSSDRSRPCLLTSCPSLCLCASASLWISEALPEQRLDEADWHRRC